MTRPRPRRLRRRRARVACAASCLLAAISVIVVPHRAHAQAPDQAGPPWFVRDSAGIEIVENRSPVWAEDAGWTLQPDPILQVGAVDGAEPYLFQRIHQVLGLADGRFAVVDGGAAGIRIFDRDGAWLRTLGRRGEGPGEFNAAPRIALARPDTLVALDAGARRLSRFLLDGTFVSDERIDASGGAGGLAMGAGGMPWRVLSTGEVLAVGGTWSSAEHARGDAEITNLEYSIALIPGGGADPLPLGPHPYRRIVSANEGSAYDPFSPTTGMTLDGPPPTLSLVSSPRWELTEISMTGEPTRIVRIHRRRSVVTDELRNHYRESIRERARERGEDPAADLRAFDLIATPDSAPAVDGLYSDGRGTRFLRHGNAVDDASAVRLEVVDREGRWLGSIALPPDAGQIVGVGRDRIFTEWRDELDVPFVRVYRLRRP